MDEPTDPKVIKYIEDLKIRYREDALRAIKAAELKAYEKGKLDATEETTKEHNDVIANFREQALSRIRAAEAKGEETARLQFEGEKQQLIVGYREEALRMIKAAEIRGQEAAKVQFDNEQKDMITKREHEEIVSNLKQRYRDDAMSAVKAAEQRSVESARIQFESEKAEMTRKHEAFVLEYRDETLKKIKAAEETGKKQYSQEIEKWKAISSSLSLKEIRGVNDGDGSDNVSKVGIENPNADSLCKLMIEQVYKDIKSNMGDKIDISSLKKTMLICKDSLCPLLENFFLFHRAYFYDTTSDLKQSKDNNTNFALPTPTNTDRNSSTSDVIISVPRTRQSIVLRRYPPYSGTCLPWPGTCAPSIEISIPSCQEITNRGGFGIGIGELLGMKGERITIYRIVSTVKIRDLVDISGEFELDPADGSKKKIETGQTLVLEKDHRFNDFVSLYNTLIKVPDLLFVPPLPTQDLKGDLKGLGLEVSLGDPSSDLRSSLASADSSPTAKSTSNNMFTLSKLRQRLLSLWLNGLLREPRALLVPQVRSFLGLDKNHYATTISTGPGNQLGERSIPDNINYTSNSHIAQKHYLKLIKNFLAQNDVIAIRRQFLPLRPLYAEISLNMANMSKQLLSIHRSSSELNAAMIAYNNQVSKFKGSIIGTNSNGVLNSWTSAISASNAPVYTTYCEVNLNIEVVEYIKCRIETETKGINKVHAASSSEQFREDLPNKNSSEGVSSNPNSPRAVSGSLSRTNSIGGSAFDAFGDRSISSININNIDSFSLFAEQWTTCYHTRTSLTSRFMLDFATSMSKMHSASYLALEQVLSDLHAEEYTGNHDLDSNLNNGHSPNPSHHYTEPSYPTTAAASSSSNSSGRGHASHADVYGRTIDDNHQQRYVSLVPDLKVTGIITGISTIDLLLDRPVILAYRRRPHVTKPVMMAHGSSTGGAGRGTDDDSDLGMASLPPPPPPPTAIDDKYKSSTATSDGTLGRQRDREREEERKEKLGREELARIQAEKQREYIRQQELQHQREEAIRKEKERLVEEIEFEREKERLRIIAVERAEKKRLEKLQQLESDRLAAIENEHETQLAIDRIKEKEKETENSKRAAHDAFVVNEASREKERGRTKSKVSQSSNDDGLYEDEGRERGSFTKSRGRQTSNHDNDNDDDDDDDDDNNNNDNDDDGSWEIPSKASATSKKQSGKERRVNANHFVSHENDENEDDDYGNADDDDYNSWEIPKKTTSTSSKHLRGGRERERGSEREKEVPDSNDNLSKLHSNKNSSNINNNSNSSDNSSSSKSTGGFFSSWFEKKPPSTSISSSSSSQLSSASETFDASPRDNNFASDDMEDTPMNRAYLKNKIRMNSEVETKFDSTGRIEKSAMKAAEDLRVNRLADRMKSRGGHQQRRAPTGSNNNSDSNSNSSSFAPSTPAPSSSIPLYMGASSSSSGASGSLSSVASSWKKKSTVVDDSAHSDRTYNASGDNDPFVFSSSKHKQQAHQHVPTGPASSNSQPSSPRPVATPSANPPNNTSSSNVNSNAPSMSNSDSSGSTKGNNNTSSSSNNNSSSSNNNSSNRNDDSGDPLPEGWEMVTSEDGQVYFYHRVTRVSRWDRPSAEVAEKVAERDKAAQRRVDEAMQKRRQDIDSKEREEQANRQAHEEMKQIVDVVINSWAYKNSNPNNKNMKTAANANSLPELLSTLPSVCSLITKDMISSGILESGCTSSSSEIKKQYMKIVRVIHPDKLPSTTTLEQRVLIEAIFIILSESYESWKSTLQHD